MQAVTNAKEVLGQSFCNCEGEYAACLISYANTCLKLLSCIHKIAFVGGSKMAEGGQQYVTFHKRSNCEDGPKVTRDNLCSLFHHMALQ